MKLPLQQAGNPNRGFCEVIRVLTWPFPTDVERVKLPPEQARNWGFKKKSGVLYQPVPMDTAGVKHSLEVQISRYCLVSTPPYSYMGETTTGASKEPELGHEASGRALVL